MNGPAIPSSRTEPRWTVALAIIAVLVLIAVLPGRIRLFPPPFSYGLGIMVLVPIVAPHEDSRGHSFF